MPDFLTLKDAAKHSGYHQDYIGQLIRDKKVVAMRVGKSWLVDRSSFISYLNQVGKVPLNKEILLPHAIEKSSSSWRTINLLRPATSLLLSGLLIVAIAFASGINFTGNISRFLASVHFADFSRTINYQGKLRNVSTGQAVTDGNYNITFKLYSAVSGGSPLWTEVNTVAVKNGLFSIPLGASSTLSGVNLNQPLYLGVAVGADSEMSPRKLLGAVPAAIVAEQLNGHFVDEFVLNNATSTIASSSAQTILTINQLGAGNIFELKKSGVLKFLVDNNGNLGLGTSTIAITNKFEVAGSGYFSGNLTAAGITATGSLTVLGNTNLSGVATINNASTSNITISGFANLSSIAGSSYLSVSGNGTIIATTSPRNSISSSATGLTYTAGSGIFSLTSGYEIPLTTSTANWNTAFGWGNHASAGYAILTANNNFSGTNTFATINVTATSTLAGNVVFGTGGLTYDASQNLTTIDNVQLGALNFEADAGILSWIDMPVTSSSSAGTVESYTAQLDGNAVLTIYGESNGTGGVQNLRVGIGSSTPTDSLSIAGTINLTGAFKTNGSAGTLGQVLQTTGTTTQWVSTSTLGFLATSIASALTNGFLARWNGSALVNSIFRDDGTVAGINATSSSYTFNVQGNSGLAAFNVSSSTGTSMLTVLANGNVGIGISNPAQLLDVEGRIRANSLEFGANNNYLGYLDQGGLVFNSTVGTIYNGYSGSNLFLSSNGGNVILGMRDDGLASYNGKVGIGTTSPSAKLSVHDMSGLAGSNPVFIVASSSSAGLATTTLLTVLGNGKVGIGTSIPYNRMSIVGSGVNDAR